MAKSPAFQFYPAEFLADENVILMSNQEIGCYIKLMCICWREGSIPSDITKLARLCGEDSSAMAQLWLSIKECFSSAIAQPLRLTHPRLEKERKKQEEFKNERSQSGVRGAQARWNKASLGDGSAMAQPMAEPMANDGSLSSSSSSSSILKEKDKTKAKKKKSSERFQEFKTLWPHGFWKNGKVAQEVWANKNLDAIADTILADVAERAAKDVNWIDGYVPLPTTYLRGDRWSDEIRRERPKTNGPSFANTNRTLAEIRAEHEAKQRREVTASGHSAGRNTGGQLD